MGVRLQLTICSLAIPEQAHAHDIYVPSSRQSDIFYIFYYQHGRKREKRESERERESKRGIG